MQKAVSSPRPTRNAKCIANIRLTGRTLRHTDAQLARLHQAPAITRSPIKNSSTPQRPALPHTMAGVSTQTEPLQLQEVELGQPQPSSYPPGAQPAAPATQPAQEMAELRAMIKDLTTQMAQPRSRRRRSSSRDRRYSPTSDRGSNGARRSSTGRRRSSSRRSSRRRSHSPRRGSRTRSSSRPRRRSSRSSSTWRSPSRAPSLQADPTAAIAAQYPLLGAHTGKRLPVRGLTLEPYRSLPPDLRKRAKERRSRRDLSFPEHMCGILKMVANTLDPASEAHAVLTHASQVAQDAATLPWPAVREWAQACMANIEDRQATWHEVSLSINDRTRLSWIRGKQMEADQHYPCPMYNRGKCDFKSTHSDQGTTWKHICALCLYVTGYDKPTHGANTCRQKNQNRPYDDHKPDNRYKGAQGRQRRDQRDAAAKN